MKRALTRSIVITFVLAVGIGTAFAQTDAEASNGSDLFKSKCVLCHGSDGTGKTPLGQQLKAADLHSLKIQKQTNTALKDAILHGKGNMPAFGAQLTAEQVDQVLKYVRQFGKKK